LSILKSRQSLTEDWITKDTFAVYNLLGDPALRIASNTAGKPTDDTFAQWRWERFTSEELADESVSSADADPDGDGQCLFLEYAFCAIPLDGTGAVPTLLTGESPDTLKARLIWRRRKNTFDLEYRLLASGDLVNWTPCEPQLDILSVTAESDGIMETVEAETPFPGETLYIKLDVIQR
jgi:hypothetical protein